MLCNFNKQTIMQFHKTVPVDSSFQQYKDVEEIQRTTPPAKQFSTVTCLLTCVKLKFAAAVLWLKILLE